MARAAYTQAERILLWEYWSPHTSDNQPDAVFMLQGLKGDEDLAQMRILHTHQSGITLGPLTAAVVLQLSGSVA